MTTRAAIKDFFAQQALAVVGVSRNEKKFGNLAYRELKGKGYRVYPINPHADVVEGERCYSNFRELPETVGGVVVVVPPQQTEEVVRAAYAAGIYRVWLQQGAESDNALRFCEEHGIETIARECVLMFAEPAAFFHKAHRFVNGVAGKLPN